MLFRFGRALRIAREVERFKAKKFPRRSSCTELGGSVKAHSLEKLHVGILGVSSHPRDDPAGEPLQRELARLMIGQVGSSPLARCCGDS